MINLLVVGTFLIFLKANFTSTWFDFKDSRLVNLINAHIIAHIINLSLPTSTQVALLHSWRTAHKRGAQIWPCVLMWLLLCKQAFRYIVIKIFSLHTAEPCLSRALSNYRQSPILQWFNFLQCVFFIPWEMCSTSISAVLPPACFVNSEAKNSFLYIFFISSYLCCQ